MVNANVRSRKDLRLGTYDESVEEKGGTFLTCQGLPTLRGENSMSRTNHNFDLASWLGKRNPGFWGTALPLISFLQYASGPPTS